MDDPRESMRLTGWAIAALVTLTLIRTWVAAVVPLVPDEAYYWVWSRALQPGYLDHPPMAALWIRLGTTLAGQTPLGVRLLGPLSAAFGTIMLYDAARRLFPDRRQAGVTAAVLLNATLGVGAGAVIMTPDTPLLFFWTAALWAAARLTAGGKQVWWLVAGGCSGLALLSKYTAVLLPLGIGLFAIRTMPRALRRPWPWVGSGFALLLFLPVMIWNARHAWVSFLKQGGRAADWQPERALSFLAELVGGQIGLATPGVFLLFAIGSAAAIGAAFRTRGSAPVLLAALILPPVLVFAQHAIGGRVQGNWPVIMYPAAAIAAAGLTAPVWRRLVWPSSGLGFVVTLLIYLHAVSLWPEISGARDPLARQMAGWDGLAVKAETVRRTADAGFIAAEPYALAAELAWALPGHVVGAGPHWDTFELPRETLRRGLLIRPEHYGDVPDPSRWTDATQAETIERPGGGERYTVFLVRPADALPPGVTLPRR